MNTCSFLLKRMLEEYQKLAEKYHSENNMRGVKIFVEI